MGIRRRRLLRSCGCTAIFGKRGISDASPSLQTFRGGISKSAGAHSDSVSPSEEPQASGVGGRNFGGLRPAIGIRRVAIPHALAREGRLAYVPFCVLAEMTYNLKLGRAVGLEPTPPD